ncbi:MAG TPA: hypothetical protein QF804_00735, partial [Rhodospirillales bacterium]|nr:hypothetical protein [Rhodospirillales bacterium]
MAEGNPEGTARRSHAPEDDPNGTAPASQVGDAPPESLAAGDLVDDAATVAALDDRPRPAPESAPSGFESPTEPDPLPLYIRYRWLTLGGAFASVLWLGGAIVLIGRSLALADLWNLLPYEWGGLVVATITPLALMWLVIAIFENGRRVRHDSHVIQWFFSKMVYPSDRAASRVSEITEDLRRQAQALRQASEEAM